MSADNELGKPPDNVKSIKVTDDFVEIEAGVDYYGNDDGYNRLTKVIMKIVDKYGRTVSGSWGKRWAKAAPGIETRRMEGSTRSGHQEHAKQQAIRIYCSACPVYVLIRHMNEYVSYDAPGSMGSYDEWLRYDIAEPDRLNNG